MQLNPFEIKTELTRILFELQGVKDFENYEVHYRNLDAQDDKNLVVKLLFREISGTNPELVKFLLLRYCPKNILINKLWEIVKSNLSSNQAKIFALDILRDVDTDWSYDECNKYLENPDELVDADTKKILDNAIINPEVQVDFLDFLMSLPDDDKVILLNSLANDYSRDELANMLIPVFFSMPDTKAGKTALDILGNSKSQLAYHALNSSLEFVDESIIPCIKRNLSILKLAGVREDNTIEFYKELLKDSKPYKFCITYPDGHGNQAIIVSRINKSGKVQFVAIVIDDYSGIKDCFGFNDISKFECNAIIERFYKGQRALDVTPSFMKSVLIKAEKLSKNKMPYEYACWRNLLMDIEPEKLNINYDTHKVSNDEFLLVLKSDFMDFWFLDRNYSDEFEEFLLIADKTDVKDFEKIIDENINKIFFPSEYTVWKNRILNVSELKHLAGDEKTAKILYSLYNDEKLIPELFKNIVRKSLYEYYFDKNDIDRINLIEDMWVNA